MILILKNKKYEVKDFAQASAIYSEARNRSGQGASRFPEGFIFDDTGNQTHYVSYNGKVWIGTEYIMGGNNVPVFNPYD